LFHNAASMPDFTFGPFLLTTDAGRLTRDGVEVRLRPRAFDTLRVLVQHLGAFVDYDTMIADAWQGTHVSRHTVDVTVADVRRQLGEYSRWIVHRHKFGYALEVPRSDELVRQGWHFWSQRTRTGCERAIDCFKRAVGESPSDFRAFEGLSASYLALAIFGIQCPLDAYPRFLEAHDQAAALSGLRPELRCNRAFGLCVFEHRPDEAEAEFLRTLEEKPSLASSYVRLGLLYGSLGRYEEALDAIGRGKKLDPLLPTIAASEVLVRCWQRDFDVAVDLGRQAIELHPYLQVVRVNYAQALQFAGRPDEAIAQYQIASIISPDVPWLRALEGACQAMLGRRRDARAMLEGLEALRRTQYVDAYHMAVFRSALRRPREAVAEQLEGFKVPGNVYDAIVSSGDVTRSVIQSRPGQTVYHLGPARDKPIFAGLDVEFAPLDRADYVVCSGLENDDVETAEDYRGRLEAMLSRKQFMLCGNPDVVVERGPRLVYCAGAVADLYKSMGGDVLYAGKPYRPIYDLALARLGGKPTLGRVLAIGDSLRTDLAGADAAGLDFLFLTAGIHAGDFGASDKPDAAALHEAFAGRMPKAIMRRLAY